MSNKQNRIDNLDKLRMEKNKLSAYCNYQEKLIGLKLEHFQANYPRILGESLLPYDTERNVEVSSLLDSVNDVISKLLPGFFRGKILPGMLLKLTQVFVINLINKSKHP